MVDGGRNICLGDGLCADRPTRDDTTSEIKAEPPSALAGPAPAVHDVEGCRWNAAPDAVVAGTSVKGQWRCCAVSSVTIARPVNRAALAQLAKRLAVEDADDRRAVRAHDWLDAAVQCVIAVEGHTRKKMMD